MLNKFKNILPDSLTSGMSARGAFIVSGVFAVLAVIQIILRQLRPCVNSTDYVWLVIVDVILAAVFFTVGMYIRSRKK